MNAMRTRAEDDSFELSVTTEVHVHKGSRAVSLHSIDIPVAAITRESLMEFAFEDPDTDVCLYINSYGGDVYESLAVADVLRDVRGILRQGKVIGVVTGHCESAAVYVLQNCDVREMSANSFIMLHGLTDSVHNLDATMSTRFIVLRDKITNIYAAFFTERTKRPRRFWDDLFSDGRPVYLMPHEALDWGLVDEVTPAWKPTPSL